MVAIKPMLCETGSTKDLERKTLIAEQKYDGTRLIIIKSGEEVTLQNRHGVDYTRRLPEVVDAAKSIEGDFVMDGEVIYINPYGEVEFTPCQQRCSTQDWTKIWYLRQKYPVVVMAFDLLKAGEEDITTRPLLDRKTVLREILARNVVALQTVRWVPHHKDPQTLFEEVRQAGDEGIILKDPASRYVHERSYSWLKVKNWRQQTCNVVGYTPGKNSRSNTFGSLVLAKDGKFAGCVGSGFSDWDLRNIVDSFEEEVEKPFDIGEPYTAVKTSLEVDVKYYKITNAGVFRFPVFIKARVV